MKRMQLFSVLFLIFWQSLCFATEANASGKLTEYLAAEKINLTVMNSDLRTLYTPITPENITPEKTYINQQLALIAAKIDTLKAFLESQQKKQTALKARLKAFRQSSSSSAEALVLQESVNQVKALIKVNEKSIELISENLNLANQYQNSLIKRERRLIHWEAKQDTNKLVVEKEAAIQVLEGKRNKLYEKSIALEKEKKIVASNTAQITEKEVSLFLNDQNILFIDHQISVLKWESALAEADYTYLEHEEDIKALEALIDMYSRALEALNTTLTSIIKTEQILNADAVIIARERDTKEANVLKEALAEFKNKLESLVKAVQKRQEQKQVLLKKQRTSRQRFEDYKEASWGGMLHQLMGVPLQFYHYLQTLFGKMADHYLWQSKTPLTLFWGTQILLVALFLSVRKMLFRVTQEKSRSRFSGHLFDGFLLLLYRSIPQFLMVTLVMTSLLLNQVVFAQAELLFHVFIVWLVYRQFKGIAQLVLLERREETSAREKRLYRRFKWLFLMGAWSIGLMLVGQELPLSFLLQDMFNRLFMLFLLAIAWVLWKSHDTIPELLYPWFRTKKRPFQHLVIFLGYFVPLIVFTTALIGLLGFIHFAWTLARYEAYAVLTLILYVLLRELLTDLLDYISEKMVSRLHNGWLWVEAIIKPLEKWLHFGLFLLGVMIVFHGLKDDWELGILSGIQTIGHYQIFSGREVHVTLFSVISALVVLLVLIWLAKWTREFCYRWLYRGVVDAAIRNSVSVFTQYAVILVGAFVFLRVLGVDLTGMGMVLGGLAVGMGFGLRDFASNIIGGLMLLIERPVREGDLITLGEYEGRVAHIGIRSMRVSSWDHMEVLIPNAETFNKPVTNWTHQDGVVRTVLPIKVSREDDPILVRKLIFDVLDIIPEVLKEPPSQVFLKQIDEALITFEVRYFVNVKLHTRFAVRSEVLFAIMAQFKAAGIKAPVPPFRIEIDQEQNEPSKAKPKSKPRKPTRK